MPLGEAFRKIAEQIGGHFSVAPLRLRNPRQRDEIATTLECPICLGWPIQPPFGLSGAFTSLLSGGVRFTITTKSHNYQFLYSITSNV